MALDMKKHYGFEQNQISNEDISTSGEMRYHQISDNSDTTYNHEKQLLLKELKTIESQLE